MVPFTTLERQNVALSLEVTPQISPNNSINLLIKQKNDTLPNPDNPGTAPVINTSEIDTSVIVKSGNILVLGGLISHELDNSNSRVPFLSDIPLIGNLFKSNQKRMEKKNLVVFLRPVIVNSGNADALTRKKYNYQRLEEKIYQQTGTITPDNKIAETPVLPPINKATTPPKAPLPSPF